MFKNGDILRLKNNPHGIMVKVTNIKKRLGKIVQVNNKAPKTFIELYNKESKWATLSPYKWEKVSPLEVTMLGIE